MLTLLVISDEIGDVDVFGEVCNVIDDEVFGDYVDVFWWGFLIDDDVFGDYVDVFWWGFLIDDEVFGDYVMWMFFGEVF